MSQTRPLDELLDAFLAHRKLVPSENRPRLAISDLSPALQELVVRTRHTDCWRAWREPSGEVRFLRSRFSATFARRHERPAIHVFHHDVDAKITASETWIEEEHGGWTHCVIPTAKPGRRNPAA